MRKKKGAEKEMETAGMMRWLLTYADMITLLLAMFILLYAISKINLEKYKQLMSAAPGAFGQKVPKIIEATRSPVEDPYNNLETGLQDAYTVIKRILEEKGMSDKIQLIIEERGLRISFMTDGVFFDLGKADLKPEFEAILSDITATLLKIKNSLRIEGHTCNIPIDTPEFPSNWELSTRRATNVLRFLVDLGVPGMKLAAAGYADTRPVAPNDAEESRVQNRRVDIIILRTVESKLEPQAAPVATHEKKHGEKPLPAPAPAENTPVP